MTTATKRRRSPRRRRRHGGDVEVKVSIRLDATAEHRRAIRDALRVYLARRANGVDVEASSNGIVVTAGYTGHVLNAGTITAAAWLMQSLDEAIPDDSPLAEVLTYGNVLITTTERNPPA